MITVDARNSIVSWGDRRSQVGQRLRYEEGDWRQNHCEELGMDSILGLRAKE